MVDHFKNIFGVLWGKTANIMLIHRDGRAGSETMGKTKVCPGPAGTLHFDSPIFVGSKPFSDKVFFKKDRIEIFFF